MRQMEAPKTPEVETFEKEKRMPYVTSVERIGYERGEAAGLRKAIERLLTLRSRLKQSVWRRPSAPSPTVMHCRRY